LLEHYLKQLRLPTVLREFPKLAEQCAKEGSTFEQFLLRLVEQRCWTVNGAPPSAESQRPSFR
jgi:hypothetical protein